MSPDRRRPRWARRAGALLLAALALACAASGLRPGVGALSFRLAWRGEADLDLYVISPLGERIDFLRRAAPSGGRLDIDCNPTVPEALASDLAAGAPAVRKLRCPHPLENVFWPKGSAPPGDYRVYVVAADAEGALPADRFRLEVRLEAKVVYRVEGEVLALEPAPLTRVVRCPAAD